MLKQISRNHSLMDYEKNNFNTTFLLKQLNFD